MSYLDKRVLLKANLETRSITEEKQSKIFFYNTDENIANLYMKLIYVTDDGLSKELQKDEVSGYSLKMTAIKPKTNQIREVDGVLSEDLSNNEGTCAIFKFQLGTEFTNQIGDVICCTKIIKDAQKLNMDYFVYTIKADKLTGLNAEITSNPDLPVLKQLIKEVKETAQTVNNIDDVNITDTKTFSNKKIEEKFTDVDSQIKENEKNFNLQLDSITSQPFLQNKEKGVVNKKYPYGNVKRYGAKGDGITDDTLAFQNCLDSCYNLNCEMLVPSCDDGKHYKINNELVVKRRGQVIKGENQIYTEIKQYNLNKNLFTCIPDDEDLSNGFSQNIAFIQLENINLRCQSGCLGAGIYAKDTQTYHGDWLNFSKVYIRGFDRGVHLSGFAQVNFTDCSICYNRINMLFNTESGSTNSNTITLVNTSQSQATECGIRFGSGFGSVIIGGDHGSNPIHFDIGVSAQVTLQGGNCEVITGEGKEFINVKSNARFTSIGTCFLNGGSNSATNRAITLEGNSNTVLISPLFSGFTLNPIKKNNPTAYVQVFGEGGRNFDLKVEELDGTLARAGYFETTVDNAFYGINEKYRNKFLSVLRRDGVAVASDRLVFGRKKRNGEHEWTDIIETKQLYNNNGSSYSRVDDMVSYKGNKLTTTSSGDKTLITITVPSFTTLYSAIATVNTNGQEYNMNCTLKSADKTTGELVFTLWHKENTQGNLQVVLNYSIDVCVW